MKRVSLTVQLSLSAIATGAYAQSDQGVTMSNDPAKIADVEQRAQALQSQQDNMQNMQSQMRRTSRCITRSTARQQRHRRSKLLHAAWGCAAPHTTHATVGGHPFDGVARFYLHFRRFALYARVARCSTQSPLSIPGRPATAVAVTG